MGRRLDLFLHRHRTYHCQFSSCLLNLITIQAKNIVNYLRIIHHILAPGGVWINLGGRYLRLDRSVRRSELLTGT